ncbi:protein of unknown function DUF4283 [Macleaya cordata]|uniref:DUF4283 domain-containing protein n=1 Tax=Macleaya cordata TaxID=56857 RepID=A0A200Q3P6_MACCD|nr:protein of unknown function DUF4283 [Macleaya cordata]
MEPPDGSAPPLSSHPPMIGLPNESRGTHAADPAVNATGSSPSRFQSNSIVPWVSLFASSKRLSPSVALSFIPPSAVDGQLTVTISTEDYNEQIRACEELLIGSFVGRRLPFTLVRDSLAKVWGLRGDFSLTIHGQSAFVFKFSCDEDRQNALEHGPVYIANRLFILRPWQPFLEHEITVLKTIPIWVCLKNVPLHMWNPKGLSSIASAIGKPIMMDSVTASGERRYFAHVCVEVSVDDILLDVIPVLVDGCRKVNVSAEYSWKPQKCSSCKTFGHSNSRCPSSRISKITQKWVQK